MATSLRLDRLLFVDLELTCWRGPPPDGEQSEIIEIGLAEVDAADLRITRSGRYLVRPARSTVSDYCTELTGITAADLRAHGRPLAQVLGSLRKDWGPGRKAWYAWGTDRLLLDEAVAAAHLEEHPFSPGFVDLAQLYTTLRGCGQRVALEDALAREGLEPEGRRHSAEGDAVDAARIWMRLAGRLR
ncbi:3'-5' exonuclease [Caenispirillum bisanense]|uniref:3'-5' exonuclease n=1 Tax=Caenispirillum bisanense TaxID=414052 RepID=UPI0031DA1E4B